MTNAAAPGPGRLLAAGLLILMGMMWGLQFAMLKLTSQGGYSEISVVMIALVLLSVAFLAISHLRGEHIRSLRGVVPFLIITAILGYVIPLFAALTAAGEISTGLLSLTGCTSPVVAVIVALLLRTERVSPRRIAAVALGVMSVAVILVPQIDAPGFGMAPWILLALVVPISYGIESVYISRHWPKGMTAMQAVTGETITAAVLVFPLFLFFSGGSVPLSDGWTLAETAILVFVGAGVVESLIYFYLIRHTGGVFVNFGTFVALFAGIGWGIVLFGESHSAMVWGAVFLLVGALTLVSREG